MMAASLSLRLAAILAFLQILNAQTPVPSRPLGFDYTGSSNGKVVIEAFYDHLCPDSRDNWPTLKEVLNAYSSKDVAGIIHIFPLPYHHNAYFMQQAGVVVRQVSHDKFVSFMEMVFANQDKFTTGAVNMTEPEVQLTIATFINTNLDIAKTMILDGFTSAVVTIDARYAWKYAASRGMTGTPQFLVNGVHVPDAAGYSASEWGNMIDTLLKGN